MTTSEAIKLLHEARLLGDEARLCRLDEFAERAIKEGFQDERLEDWSGGPLHETWNKTADRMGYCP